jgi:nitroimidazol reductase NimA-like FMN-containing flavoprotein (pyridoxamine 5'-phosphate oxidase superfamily)
MRRQEKEITDPGQIASILDRARVLCLALHDEPAPYAIPVVHSAPRGAKIDLLSSHPRVGFTAWADETLVTGETACDWGVRASSVAGIGTARVVTDPPEKLRGLDAIMRHYGAAGPVYRPDILARTTVIAIAIDSMRARRVG